MTLFRVWRYLWGMEKTIATEHYTIFQRLPKIGEELITLVFGERDDPCYADESVKAVLEVIYRDGFKVKFAVHQARTYERTHLGLSVTEWETRHQLNDEFFGNSRPETVGWMGECFANWLAVNHDSLKQRTKIVRSSMRHAHRQEQTQRGW